MASSNVVVSKIDRLTLCIISLILQKQIPRFKLLHCTIISEWNAPTTFSLETHLREARRYLQQLLTMDEQPTQQRFYKNDHCETCPNKAPCMDELISKDDMSLLGSMSRGQISGLNRRGILTINQLSYTFRRPKSRIAAMQPARPNYALKALALREKQTFVLEPPIFPDQPTEVFVDFEGFPDERCVYLIGMIIREKQGGNRKIILGRVPQRNRRHYDCISR